ncbi:hypothetical protein PAMP_020132 [Pampus punctatissimus]
MKKKKLSVGGEKGGRASGRMFTLHVLLLTPPLLLSRVFTFFNPIRGLLVTDSRVSDRDSVQTSNDRLGRPSGSAIINLQDCLTGSTNHRPPDPVHHFGFDVSR